MEIKFRLRRNLLITAFSLPIAAAAAAVTAAAPAPKQTNARKYLLNRFSIAGFQYYAGPALLRTPSTLDPPLQTGTPLTLTPEPRNPYDEFAVRIDCRSVQIGYVPRSDNRHISRLLQQEAELFCEVIEVNPEEVFWRMVRVSVGVKV